MAVCQEFLYLLSDVFRFIKYSRNLVYLIPKLFSSYLADDTLTKSDARLLLFDNAAIVWVYTLQIDRK